MEWQSESINITVWLPDTVSAKRADVKMAESILTLKHCEVFFSEGPETRLTFNCDPVKLQLSDWSIQLLMRALPSVVAKVQDVEKEDIQDLPDQILHSVPLFKSRSNCLKLESSVYQGKTFIFLKSFFLDKNKNGAKALTGFEGEDLVMDEIQEEFDRLAVYRREKGPAEKWIPKTNPIRLDLEDVFKLRHFILMHYKRMSQIN